MSRPASTSKEAGRACLAYPKLWGARRGRTGRFEPRAAVLCCRVMAYITRIQIEQCRNVRQLDIDLSVPALENGASGPEPSQRPKFRHLILTGPNGSGKSGVLEDVAMYIDMLFYPRLGGVNYHSPNTIDWDVRANPHLIDIAVRGDALAVYLPARRQIHSQKVAGPSKLDWEPAKLRPKAEASERLLLFLVNKRMEMALAAEDSDSAVVERIRDWFARLEAHLRRLMEDDGLTLEFDRRAYTFNFRRTDGHVFDLNTLADGHAAVLTILAELLIRVDVIRETRKDFTFEPEGVVVIDEIETHLHLSLQEQILPLLTELFPRFQFLVATHSPAVIASVPNAVVYDLKKRSQTLSDHFRGVRYGRLMTEHFGISSEIDLDSTEKLVRLRDLSGRPTRTPEEERELADLTALLTARTPSLAVEVWMTKERLGYDASAAVGEER